LFCLVWFCLDFVLVPILFCLCCLSSEQLLLKLCLILS
jgi:hypothetical protein